MDIARGFKAVFEDPGWVGKLLLAFLFEVLIVTSPAVLGYFLRYTRNVAEGRDTPLPEWSGFGGYWVKGFVAMLAGFVYVIVGLILFIIGVIPAVILFQAALVEYAMTERGGSLFAIGTIWRRITTYSQFWVAWAVAFGLSIASSIVTSPFNASDNSSVKAIGGLIGAALGLYFLAVETNLFGQYARVAFAPTQAMPPAGTVPPAGTGYAPPPPAGGYPPQPAAPAAYPPPPPPPPPAGGQPPAQ